ncbi:MAG: hypothetical protein EBZ98_03280 [Actinobacteria bacterium]|nr:hypothetical protein [Actinomycetota bacterium]
MPLQVTVVDHPVAQEALTHLRDQDTSNQMFRAEMRRLSLVVVAEATRRIPTRSRTPQRGERHTRGFCQETTREGVTGCLSAGSAASRAL